MGQADKWNITRRSLASSKLLSLWQKRQQARAHFDATSAACAAACDDQVEKEFEDANEALWKADEKLMKMRAKNLKELKMKITVIRDHFVINEDVDLRHFYESLFADIERLAA